MDPGIAIIFSLSLIVAIILAIALYDEHEIKVIDWNKEYCKKMYSKEKEKVERIYNKKFKK